MFYEEINIYYDDIGKVHVLNLEPFFSFLENCTYILYQTLFKLYIQFYRLIMQCFCWEFPTIQDLLIVGFSPCCFRMWFASLRQPCHLSYLTYAFGFRQFDPFLLYRKLILPPSHNRCYTFLFNLSHKRCHISSFGKNSLSHQL